MLKSKIFETFGLENFGEDSLLSNNEDELYKAIENDDMNTDKDWEKLDYELENLIDLTEEYELFGYDLKQALKVMKKDNMKDVLDFYLNSFSLLNTPKYKNKPFVTGVLLMDLETGWGIMPKKKLLEQIIEIKEIIGSRNIIPFLPIDPRRCDKQDGNENLYNLFLKAFNDKGNSFFGVKCYPSLGYLPSDMRLDPIFKICSEKNIPVMTHCGGEIVSTYEKSFNYHSETGIKNFIIPGDNRTERAKFLNDPSRWEPVLKKYNNLKLCFGHFGGDTNWEEYSKTGNNERIQKIVSMMKNPEWNVFADFSYNVVEENLFDAFCSFLYSNREITHKILFGTDYWVVLPAGDLLKMQESFIEKIDTFDKISLNTAPLNYLIN
jgi:predicted TIM-barrel fold metal-dependent hydrolase